MLKKPATIILFLSLALVLFSYFFFFHKTPEKHQAEEIKQGLMEMVAGTVVGIDQSQNNFDVDIDPLGTNKTYTIYADNGTKFFSLRYPKPQIGKFKKNNSTSPSEFEEGQSFIRKPAKKISVNFDYLKKRMLVEIYFYKRLNPKKSKLIAKSVNIIEHGESTPHH